MLKYCQLSMIKEMMLRVWKAEVDFDGEKYTREEELLSTSC